MNKISIPRNVLEKLYLHERKNAYQIARKLNCGHTTVYRKLEEYRIKRRDNSTCHLRYNKTHFSGDKKEMAYLIGFRLGDLHVRKAVNSPGCKTVRVESHTTKEVQIKLVKSLFEKYSHVHCKGISNKTLRALCFLDESFLFLLPKKDRIENWILSDKDLFLSFLAGYVDAEGHIGIHSKNGNGRLKILTQDKGIIFSVQRKLVKIGIKCPKPRLAVIKGYTSPSYPNKPMNKDVWEINVNGENVKILLRHILPYLKHEERKKAALHVLNKG